MRIAGPERADWFVVRMSDGTELWPIIDVSTDHVGPVEVAACEYGVLQYANDDLGGSDEPIEHAVAWDCKHRAECGAVCAVFSSGQSIDVSAAAFRATFGGDIGAMVRFACSFVRCMLNRSACPRWEVKPCVRAAPTASGAGGGPPTPPGNSST